MASGGHDLDLEMEEDLTGQGKHVSYDLRCLKRAFSIYLSLGKCPFYVTSICIVDTVA